MDARDDELDELRSIGTPDRAWDTPPTDLWDRIATAVAAEESDIAAAPVVALPRRRGHGSSRWLAAAAALLVVAVGTVTAWIVLDDGGPDDTVVARAPLERLAGSGTGSAELVDHDGAFRLRLTTDGLDQIDGYYEVWLLEPDVSGLISLGPLRPDGTYDLPSGVDPAVFPVVDISIEPLDGNPAHSSNSVLRGQLDLPS